MAAKKFKRVIPGQLEKLKEMFDGGFFNDDYVIARVYENDDRFQSNAAYSINEEYMKNNKNSFFRRAFFGCVKNSVILSIIMKRNSITKVYELYKITFDFSFCDIGICDDKINNNYRNNKRVRELLDELIPSYYRLESNWMDYLDSKCIEYIEKIFYDNVQNHEEAFMKWMTHDNGHDYDLIGDDFEFFDVKFTDEEKKEIKNLRVVRSVLNE